MPLAQNVGVAAAAMSHAEDAPPAPADKLADDLQLCSLNAPPNDAEFMIEHYSEKYGINAAFCHAAFHDQALLVGSLVLHAALQRRGIAADWRPADVDVMCHHFFHRIREWLEFNCHPLQLVDRELFQHKFTSEAGAKISQVYSSLHKRNGVRFNVIVVKWIDDPELQVDELQRMCVSFDLSCCNNYFDGAEIKTFELSSSKPFVVQINIKKFLDAANSSDLTIHVQLLHRINKHFLRGFDFHRDDIAGLISLFPLDRRHFASARLQAVLDRAVDEELLQET